MFKFFDKYYVNLLLSTYFCVVGIYTLAVTLQPLLGAIFGTNHKEFKFEFNLPYFGKQKLQFTWVDAVGFVLASCASGMYLKTKHWALNNFLGVGNCRGRVSDWLMV